jgi:hypothetical protein
MHAEDADAGRCCVVHAPFGFWPRHRRRRQEGCTPQAQPAQPARTGTASSIAVDGGQALSTGEQRRVLDSGVHECGWGATKGKQCACKAFICLHAWALVVVRVCAWVSMYSFSVGQCVWYCVLLQKMYLRGSLAAVCPSMFAVAGAQTPHSQMHCTNVSDIPNGSGLHTHTHKHTNTTRTCEMLPVRVQRDHKQERIR